MDFKISQFTEEKNGTVDVAVSFASDLQIPPGGCPRKITIAGFGNGQPFLLTAVDNSGQRFVYQQQLGCVRAHIYNT